MKVAMLINRDNFDKYANWDDTGWELSHFGNGEPDAAKIIETGAKVLVADAVMKVGPEIIRNMPELKLIHSQGVAYNSFDIGAAKDAGIYVCNCAGVNAQPVAEQAVLLMLALLRNFRQGEEMVYAGRQMEAKTACFQNGQPELSGQKIGIVGFGAIGGALANILRPFGCEIWYYTRSGDRGAEGASYHRIEDLYASCDIVSLNVPVTPETTNMINDETLASFKRGAILINTARGELVDHAAVIRALVSGQLGGFGTDTLSPEPVLADNPFLRALPEGLRGRVALSPHTAGITSGSFIRSYGRIKNNIRAVAGGGRPECVVNGL